MGRPIKNAFSGQTLEPYCDTPFLIDFSESNFCSALPYLQNEPYFLSRVFLIIVSYILLVLYNGYVPGITLMGVDSIATGYFLSPRQSHGQNKLGHEYISLPYDSAVVTY